MPEDADSSVADPRPTPRAWEVSAQPRCPVIDLPLENWTVLIWNLPLMIPGSGQGEFHEAVEVHGGVDRVRPQTSGGRFADCEGVLQDLQKSSICPPLLRRRDHHELIRSIPILDLSSDQSAPSSAAFF